MIATPDQLMRPLSRTAALVGQQMAGAFLRWAKRQAWEAIQAAPGLALDRLGLSVGAAARAHADAIYDGLVASYLRGAGDTAKDIPPLRYEPLRALFEVVLPGSPQNRSLAAKGLQGLATGLVDVWAEHTAPPSLPPPAEPPAIEAAFYSDGDPLIRFPKLVQAVRNLARRQILDPVDFYQLGSLAKRQAWTISGGLEADSLELGRSLLMENVRDAADREDFVARMEQGLGTLPLGEAHMEQVFRNNVNTAYSEGARRVLDHPGVIDAFPYRAYFAIHDDRVRPEHVALETLGLNGTNIYHRTDPVWLRFEPPWAWNCRCGWIALTVSDAARKGVREAQKWLDTGIEPIHRYVDAPAFEPPPGWDRNYRLVA